MLEHNAGADVVFGFHVQPAVEELLKAWLSIRGESYPLTHDLEQSSVSNSAVNQPCERGGWLYS